jgi:hypothetical protein
MMCSCAFFLRALVWARIRKATHLKFLRPSRADLVLKVLVELRNGPVVLKPGRCGDVAAVRVPNSVVALVDDGQVEGRQRGICLLWADAEDRQ